jgi:hypothetical protein
MKLLLSGLIGAFIATTLTIIYNYIREQVRHRRDVMMQAVSWVDDIYDRLQMMQVQKERVYAGKEPAITTEEYKITTREVKTLLLSSKIPVLVALVYGEGNEVQKINALQGEMTKVAEILWQANKDTWDEASKKIFLSFSKIIDPVKEATFKRFLHGTRARSIVSDFLKSNLSTFYKIFTFIRNKKRAIFEK